MTLKVLGSNSKGNCYILENESEILVIEAGISVKEVMREIKFQLRKVKGVIVTHEHKDHSKYVHEWILKAVPVYMSFGTAKALCVSGQRSVNEMSGNHVSRLGGFKILPFNVQHDCEEPFGFLINHADMGNLLFATDTFYIRNRFKDLNHILIECNYCESILAESDQMYKDRVLSSHMSMETCIEFLKANDLSRVENIVLLHLSDSHSDEKLMQQRVIEATGINTVVADKGVKMDLSKWD